MEMANELFLSPPFIADCIGLKLEYNDRLGPVNRFVYFLDLPTILKTSTKKKAAPKK
jgi:hypothetical protein